MFRPIIVIYFILLVIIYGRPLEITADGSESEKIENSSYLADRILEELRNPGRVMTVVNRPPGVIIDADCPLSLCNNVKAIIAVPGRPRFFLVCSENRQYCGLCPSGMVFRSAGDTFKCEKSDSEQENDIRQCDVNHLCGSDFSERLRIMSDINGTINFIICSNELSFCGYCPSESAAFNQTAVSCDDLYPETKFICQEESTMKIYPDPLTVCSPLAYVCLPGKRRGIPTRCPNEKMRHNQWHMTCALPSHVPECGGQLQPFDNSTSWETTVRFNVTEFGPRGGEGSNCLANCYYQTQKLMACRRICTEGW